MGSEGLFWAQADCLRQVPYWDRVVLFLGLACRRRRSDGRDGVAPAHASGPQRAGGWADAWSNKVTEDVELFFDMRVRVRVRVHSWVLWRLQALCSRDFGSGTGGFGWQSGSLRTLEGGNGCSALCCSCL